MRQQQCTLTSSTSIIRWHKSLNFSSVAYRITVSFPDDVHLLSGFFVDDEQSKH